MEIAHAQTSFLRVLGKLVLLGLLVILLSKVIALAVVGLLTYFCARALYTRRARLTRILFLAKEKLIQSVGAVFQMSTTVAIAAACSVSWAVLRLSLFIWTKANRNLGRLCAFMAETLRASTVLACRLLGHAAKISCVTTWKVMASAILFSFCHGKRIAGSLAQVSVRGSVRVSRALGAALVTTRDQSTATCGTMVEASSGALIGAMLGLIPSFLPLEQPIQARVFGAALFGAFLGITVGLSRTTWAKDGEPSQILESKN